MGLVPMIMAVVVGAVVITSATSWLLSLNAKISNIDGRLEAMTIATSEWNRLNAMPMDAIEAQKDKLANYTVGEYQLSVILGDKGVMDEGTCKTTGISADETRNCYNDSKVIIKKDGETLYSSKLLPLSTDGEGGGGGAGFPDMSKGFTAIPSNTFRFSGVDNQYIKVQRTGYRDFDEVAYYYLITAKKNLWCKSGTDWIPVPKGRVAYNGDIAGITVGTEHYSQSGSTETMTVYRINPFTCYPAKK